MYHKKFPLYIRSNPNILSFLAFWSFQKICTQTKTEWVKEWRAMGVRFSWSILADDPTFEVGDWVQGFTTMTEPHGSNLDLKVVWKIKGKRFEKILPKLQCAQAPIE